MDGKENSRRREFRLHTRLALKRDKENKPENRKGDSARQHVAGKAKLAGQANSDQRTIGPDHVLALSDRNQNYSVLEEWGVFSVGWDEIHGDLFHLDGRSHEMGQKYCGIYEKEVDSQLESAFDTIEIEDIDSCDEMEYDLDSYERYTPKYDREVNTWTSFGMVNVDVDSPGTISTLSGDFPMELLSDSVTCPESIISDSLGSKLEPIPDGPNSNTTLPLGNNINPTNLEINHGDVVNDNFSTDENDREQNTLRNSADVSNLNKTSHLQNINNGDCILVDNYR